MCPVFFLISAKLGLIKLSEITALASLIILAASLCSANFYS